LVYEFYYLHKTRSNYDIHDLFTVVLPGYEL